MKIIKENNTKTPNATTLKAMKEAQTMCKNKNRKSYADVEDFLDFLKA